MSKQSKEEKHKIYLQQKINPIMEKLVVDLLISKPDDVLDYMGNWIQNQKDKKIVVIDRSKKCANAYGENSASDTESDENEDEEVIEIVIAKPKGRNMRTSVSAEAYGQFNQLGKFVPKVIPKSPETYKRIEDKLLQAFMFSALDDKERDIIINSIEEKNFKKGDNVIKQGEDGETLYIVDSGQLDCYKQFNKDEEPKHLKVYQPGESFGELALLYNAPRAATIISKTDSLLYSLDRDCFNHIVKGAAQKKREGYENLLKQIDILQEMDPYERTQLADALKPIKFKTGQYVVKQGDQGDQFFFVEQGKASAYKQLNNDQQPFKVMDYNMGDYFGELALLRDQPRAASIIAETDLSLASLDRQTFKRILGPLEELLKRNFSKYKNLLI